LVTVLTYSVKMATIGVPLKVLHEAEGHIVTVETTTGEVYRGKLVEAEDNMNSQMSSVTVTHRDGRVAQLEHIYIRGSKVRFMILPDMLKNAPMLKNMNTRGGTRGKSAILGAQAGRGGRGGGFARGSGFGAADRGAFIDRVTSMQFRTPAEAAAREHPPFLGLHSPSQSLSISGPSSFVSSPGSNAPLDGGW